MIPFCTESPASSFIIVTESGILHRLRKLVPGKEFIPAPTEQCSCSTCPYMKMNTLENCTTPCVTSPPPWNCRKTCANGRRPPCSACWSSPNPDRRSRT